MQETAYDSLTQKEKELFDKAFYDIVNSDTVVKMINDRIIELMNIKTK